MALPTLNIRCSVMSMHSTFEGWLVYQLGWLISSLMLQRFLITKDQ